MPSILDSSLPSFPNGTVIKAEVCQFKAMNKTLPLKSTDWTADEASPVHFARYEFWGMNALLLKQQCQDDTIHKRL